MAIRRAREVELQLQVEDGRNVESFDHVRVVSRDLIRAYLFGFVNTNSQLVARTSDCVITLTNVA